MEGFVFDLAGIEAALAKWRALRDELAEDENVAWPLAQIVGPGEEQASWDMARQAVRSGELFRRHNKEMRAVVDQYITALTASRNQYLQSDEANRDKFTRGEDR